MNKLFTIFMLITVFMAPGCRNLWRRQQHVHNTVAHTSAHKPEATRKSGPEGWNVAIEDKE